MRGGSGGPEMSADSGPDVGRTLGQEAAAEGGGGGWGGGQDTEGPAEATLQMKPHQVPFSPALS